MTIDIRQGSTSPAMPHRLERWWVDRFGALDAIRLDAYAGAAGAAGFYRAAGFREVGQVTYRGTPLVYFEMLL